MKLDQRIIDGGISVLMCLYGHRHRLVDWSCWLVVGRDGCRFPRSSLQKFLIGRICKGGTEEADSGRLVGNSGAKCTLMCVGKIYRFAVSCFSPFKVLRFVRSGGGGRTAREQVDGYVSCWGKNGELSNGIVVVGDRRNRLQRGRIEISCSRGP